jgi:hypothetical protein
MIWLETTYFFRIGPAAFNGECFDWARPRNPISFGTIPIRSPACTAVTRGQPRPLCRVVQQRSCSCESFLVAPMA